MLTYAATTPKTLNASSRKNYSAFLRYAAGPGQVIGDQPGQLPNGYVPLPAALESETLAAAATVLQPAGRRRDGEEAAEAARGRTRRARARAVGLGLVRRVRRGLVVGSADGSGSGPGRARRSNHGSSRAAGVIGPSALSAVRTEGFAIGLLRWALPFLLFVGLGAALGAVGDEPDPAEEDAGRCRRRTTEPSRAEPGPPEGDAP